MVDEKKNIFQKIGDAFSSKDEKEALAKAQADLDLKKKAAIDEANRKRVEQAQKLKAAAEVRAAGIEDVKKKAAIDEANRKRIEQAEKMKAAAEVRAAEFESRKKEMELKAAAAFITEHTVTNDDTLSGIALKYYKHATEPYWRFIYESNKAVIGDNPGILRPGIVLKILTLPESLKK